MDSTKESDSEEKKVPWVMSEPKEAEEAASNPLGLLLIVALFAALFIWGSKFQIVIALGIIISIFLHELGHFLTARWSGMKVTQFFLFFGPRLWSFKRGETEYGIRAIPLGAFVRVVGMNNLDPCEDPADEPRAYQNMTYPRKMWMITAGSMMHFIQAVLILVFMFSILGIKTPIEESGWYVHEVSEESGASAAGLLEGDQILSIDDRSVSNFGDLSVYVSSKPGETIEIDLLRQEKPLTIEATLGARKDDPSSGFLGVEPKYNEYERNRYSAITGVEETGGIFKSLFFGFDDMGRGFMAAFRNTLNFDDVVVDTKGSEIPVEANKPSSVLGVYNFAGNFDSDDGWEDTMWILAGFNVVVGVLNLFPMLPFDGGHAAVATYERIRSRKGKRYEADFEKMIPVTYAMIGLLGILTVLTIFWDITSPIVLK